MCIEPVCCIITTLNPDYLENIIYVPYYNIHNSIPTICETRIKDTINSFFLCLNLISIFASVALFHVVIVFVAVKLFDTFQTKLEWVWRTGRVTFILLLETLAITKINFIGFNNKPVCFTLKFFSFL